MQANKGKRRRVDASEARVMRLRNRRRMSGLPRRLLRVAMLVERAHAVVQDGLQHVEIVRVG